MAEINPNSPPPDSETGSERKPIVVSGIRPTGRVHLGNYWGAVKNWIDLQDKYDCNYFIADIHALTTAYADPTGVREATFEVAKDILAAGLDPEKSVFFVQSRVPHHSELAVLLGMLTPLGWLERVPTFKDTQEQLKDRDLNTHGFLGYPVLMTADVALYLAEFVPVGKDQESHLEIAREIVRRFNGFYGEVFPEPKPLFTPSPKVPGLDARKMSKSYDNTIALTAPASEVTSKVMSMVTDPARARRSDPGTPETCNLFPFHVLYSPPEEVSVVDVECRTAARGCVDCKKHLIRNMNAALEPLREKRAGLDSHPETVREILEAGSEKARSLAQVTMQKVTQAMGLI